MRNALAQPAPRGPLSSAHDLFGKPLHTFPDYALDGHDEIKK
jgi:hypothetical protein